MLSPMEPIDIAELNEWASALLRGDHLVRSNLTSPDEFLETPLELLITYEMADGFTIEEFVQSAVSSDGRPVRVLALRVSDGPEVDETRWHSDEIDARLASDKPLPDALTASQQRLDLARS